ncbi:pancreatic triacylglycerol lipase-like [Agrilus planipennis]|uniref:Pancreatic triacylglycerol lipase-like n=1 Tax=Agrilus planipennis TaxID=224129 RepID=A0A1W4XDL3_AGRPL|nr:pancreatic triacylglycerol lipase-like [Agrilus planipennis]
MMRVLLILANIAFIAVAIPLNVSDASIRRFITLYDDQGRPEVFDRLAPLPETFVSKSDLTLYLYTRANPSTPVRLQLNVNEVASVRNFDRSKLNVFVIHGWTNNYQSNCNSAVMPAFLQALDVNVFVVDWSGPAGGKYTSAFSSVPKVGKLLGTFIESLQSTLRLGASQFLLVGHSLGAHVAGCAGAAVNGNIGIIVGLDPAGPGFLSSNTNNRLDPTDAQFVQAIHTNTLLLGYSGNLGNVDIRPNGGRSQPGCGTDVTGSCSHSRSYQYFAESVASGGFTAWACSNYREFSRGSCETNAKTALGGANIDVSASGEFFLETNSRSPYSLG